MRHVAQSLSIAAILLAAAQHTAIAEEYKLTIAAASPAVVTPSFVTKNFLVPTVTERAKACGDTLTITEAYGQTLAKGGEMLEAIEEGIAHAGVVLRNFEEAKLPFAQYPTVMPFVVADPAVMTEVDRVVREKVPAMNAMYDRYGQVFLAGASEHSMQMFTTFPVKRYEDLAGHKIGASGALGHYVRGTGAVVVNSDMLQSFTSIKNGLYDGYPIAIHLAFPFKTYQVAKYYTQTDFGPTTLAAFTVNADTWASFSDCLKKVFQDTAAEWSQEYVKLNSERIAKFTGIIKEQGGNEFSEMSQAERARWAKALPPLAKEWADALEAKGLGANAVVKAFMEEARARGITPLRDWDKE